VEWASRRMDVADLPALVVLQERGAMVGLSQVFPQETHPFRPHVALVRLRVFAANARADGSTKSSAGRPRAGRPVPRSLRTPRCSSTSSTAVVTAAVPSARRVPGPGRARRHAGEYDGWEASV
jgi:hypothetical protein